MPSPPGPSIWRGGLLEISFQKLRPLEGCRNQAGIVLIRPSCCPPSWSTGCLPGRRVPQHSWAPHGGERDGKFCLAREKRNLKKQSPREDWGGRKGSFLPWRELFYYRGTSKSERSQAWFLPNSGLRLKQRTKKTLDYNWKSPGLKKNFVQGFLPLSSLSE